MKIFVKDKEKELPCGTIYMDGNILDELYCISGKEKVSLK